MLKEFSLLRDVSLERLLISSLGKKKQYTEIRTEFGYLFINNLKMFDYLKAFIKKNPVQLTFSH